MYKPIPRLMRIAFWNRHTPSLPLPEGVVERSVSTALPTLTVRDGAVPPPPSVPLAHFAAALAWLVFGSALLVRVAPSLAAGLFLAPPVLAVTHAFTLGVVATGIVGALSQMGPVALGVAVRSLATTRMAFALLQVGAALIVAGLWWWWPAVTGAGWVCVSSAMTLAAWNLWPSLTRPVRGPLLARFVLAGFAAFFAGILVAGTRIGDALGWWHLSREALLLAHVHLALVGFATLVAVGVGSRVFPMFLLSRRAPSRRVAVAGSALGVGAATVAVGALARVGPVQWGGVLLLGIGALLFVGDTALHFRDRARRHLDPGLALVAWAFVGLALATVAGGFTFASSAASRHAVTTYGVLLLTGWLVPLVAGIAGKIVPFIAWIALFGRGPSRSKAPAIPELLSAPLGWGGTAGLAAGGALLAAGTATASVVVATTGALFMLVGALFTLALYAKLALGRESALPVS